MQIRPSALEIPTNDPFKNDCLSRKELEPPLTQFVTQAIGSFVLAVDGSWGSGKTTFLNMWQVKLNEAGHLCLYLNAWKSDFVEDPLVAVVGELSIAINANPLLAKDNVRKTIDNIEKKTRSIVNRLIPAAVKAATRGVLDLDSGVETDLATATGSVTESLIKNYEDGKTDIEVFRSDLKFLANELQKNSEDPVKIVIIIDELDRCRPTYAVQLLERVKHLFDVEGIVFVLGIDRAQLSHSIKALYGSEFDATGYLKRFIDLDYCLPEPDLECYCLSLFQNFGIEDLVLQRKSLNPNYELGDLHHYLGYLMSSARMTLRDQEQVVSRLRVVLQTIPGHEQLYPVTLSILLFLREWDRDTYESVIRGDMTCESFMNFISRLPNEVQAFQEFLKNAACKNYDGFSRERIENFFWVWSSEVSDTSFSMFNEYVKNIQSRQNPNDQNKALDIIEISKRGAGFKKTDRRLSLTSNFVKN